MQIAIGMPIGYPVGSAKAAGVFDYLLNDTFTTDRAAGAVNGTDAEPGPGRRVVIDTNNKVSLSGGQLLFATGGVAQADPQLYYTPVARAAGRLVVAQLGGITETIGIGFDAAGASPHTAGSAVYGVRFAGSSRTLQVYNNAVPLSVGNWAAATTYQIAVVARATGTLFFIKGGAFTGWTMLWHSSVGTQADLYPAAVVDSATAVFAADYIRVPSARWLPAPILSDGFSAWGSSDGLGHAEGIAGGLGSGGAGLAYTTVGTWGASGGVAAASALNGGFAIAYRALSTADIIASVKVARAGGDAGLILRYTDSNNHITCHHNGTNVVLLKKAAGVATTVQSTAATYVAGAELRVVADGTAFRVYYNNALVGSAQTISDAEIQSATNVGLYTTNTGNTFDDFTVYARGTGGEHSALDAF